MDAFLFKAFKFFDLLNTGFLAKQEFFRAIAKCGVVVDTHVTSMQIRTWILFLITTLPPRTNSTTDTSSNNYFLGRKKSSLPPVAPKPAKGTLLTLWKTTARSVSANLEPVSKGKVKPNLPNPRWRL